MDDDLGQRFAIKLSYARGRVRCALCDEFTVTLNGPDLYLVDTWEAVCWDCGLKLAPELVRMLGAYWKARAESWGRVTWSA